MRKALFFALATMIVGVFIGCKPSSTKQNEGGEDSTSANANGGVAEEKDTTFYGEFQDGGHGAFILKANNDSTYEFIVDIDNDSNVVFGGLGNQGDQMAVTYRTNDFNERIVTKVINLTTLQATWTSLDRNFEIEKGGGVESHQQGETRPWTSWRILNGRLLLNTDTFDIDQLDGDSLILENDRGIYAYARMKKK